MQEQPGEELYFADDQLLTDFFLLFDQSLQQVDTCLQVLQTILFQVFLDVVDKSGAVPADIGQ